MTLETISVDDSTGTQVHSFHSEELTAFCPFDFGGPDFYTIDVVYTPDGTGIETRSFKEHLRSFRDVEITAERLAVTIFDDIYDSIEPRSMYLRLEQNRRGGIEETVEVFHYE